jgi:phosphohistidine phosphatase
MNLYLMQHGEALPKEQDAERHLSAKGRQDVENLAGFLERAGVRAGRVMHSGKTRALQTAEILAPRLSPGVAPESLEGLASKDPVMPFAELAATWDEDTLVVGHQPFLSHAVCLLLTGIEEHAAIGFHPASLVCLEREADGPWGLAWMLTPELVRA